MKPIVSAGNAYFCVFTSIFGIIILGVLSVGFGADWEALMGKVSDPEGKSFIAIIYLII